MQQRRHIHARRLQHLAARKREQLVRQLCAANAGPRGRRRQLLRSFILQAGQLLQHLQVALDDCEQVVEVVRDAAGELAHAFRALRVLQRLIA